MRARGRRRGWQQVNLHPRTRPGSAVGAKDLVPGWGAAGRRAYRSLLLTGGCVPALGEPGWLWGTGELGSPNGSGKGAADPKEKRKRVLIIRFLVYVHDLPKCCHVLECCILTAPVSFRAGEGEKLSSLLQLLNSNVVLSICSPCPCWCSMVHRLEQSSPGWAVVCGLRKHKTQEKGPSSAAGFCCLSKGSAGGRSSAR